ncbi:hypothetical protein [Bacterioplanoides sp.]|uniref:hypothetical protein n=1 Tax=Bacterioplanoides sp. TaxID=2066072 RepID=UPI003AFFDFD9
MTTEHSQYDDEYYIVSRGGEGSENHPLIDVDWEILSDNKGSGMFSSPWSLIQDGYVFPIRLGQPVPKNPEIVDFHRLPYTFSYRVIKDVAQRRDMPGVQWFPAYIHHDGQRYNDYVIMHAYKEIKCLDKNKSDYKVRG